MASDSKKKKLKAVTQKVKLFRANDPLLSVFMWGINHSIQELSHVNVPVMLMPDDFKAHTKTRVDNHLFNKENMPSHFKFKEYCPIVFRNLRERFGIEDEEYCNSLTKFQPYPADSSGRSGAKFWWSYDRAYFLKTLISEEVEQVHHILKQYHWYVVERHAVTLLPHFLGMYRTTVNDQETYLLVMRNVFSPRLVIHKKYDLKGSTVDRQASDKEKAKELPTFKDNDFLRDEERIYLGQTAKDIFTATLQADTEFLMTHGLMDYSLLIGIHDRDNQTSELDASPNHPGVDDENGHQGNYADAEVDDAEGPDCSDSEPMDAVSAGPPDSPTTTNAPMTLFTGQIDPQIEVFGIPTFEGAPKNYIYFMAIVDILTKYGMKKRTAKAAKTVKHGTGAEISTVKPEQYARRFLEFVTKNIE